MDDISSFILPTDTVLWFTQNQVPVPCKVILVDYSGERTVLHLQRTDNGVVVRMYYLIYVTSVFNNYFFSFSFKTGVRVLWRFCFKQSSLLLRTTTPSRLLCNQLPFLPNSVSFTNASSVYQYASSRNS